MKQMAVTGNSISFQPLNANAVRVIGGTKDLIPHFKDGELISLDIIDERKVCLGETFKIKSVPYKVNTIKEVSEEVGCPEGETCYDLIMAERTKTSLFILPMLGGDRRLLFYDSLFINAYLELGDKQDFIVLLYRKSKKKVFTEFIGLLQHLKTFESIEGPNSHCYVIKFTIPWKHRSNFKKFKAGKYSELNDTYKLDVLDFHRYDIDGRMGQILFKSSERRKELELKLDAVIPKESELYSIMDEEQEKLNLETYF